MKARAQYLTRYAEPEAAFAGAFDDSYLAALVVPARAEGPNLLDGLQPALERAPGRVLLVLVVNGSVTDGEATHAENQRLLRHLAGRYPERRELHLPQPGTRAVLARQAQYDVLWLDCASEGARLPARTGVGTVRKLGGDLAAALWDVGRLACPRIASTDADVTLPEDYFEMLTREVDEPVRSSAWLWPFSHEAGGDAAIDAATVLYEISLRYYVLGLAAAGSPYAYQSIGSTVCVDAPAYLSVRGFPKREAGEDFYLLDKLAKVAPLHRVQAAPLRIRARSSDRVPFGTGRRSREISEQSQAGQEFALYAPGTFQALGALLEGLDAFATSGRVQAVERALHERIPHWAEAAHSVLTGLGLFAALSNAVGQAPLGPVLRRRVHTWFDALRTLRFVHGLRERCLPSVPWHEALAAAPFLSQPFRDGVEASAVCRVLADQEAALPSQVGPSLF